MKNLVLVSVIFISLISCQTNNLAVDYDNAYDFTKVKTYNYYTDNRLQLNRIDSANFMRTLDQTLQSKGLVRDMNNPDINIAVLVYSQEQTKTNSVVNLGVGGGSGWFGMGTSVGIPINSKVVGCSIQIDFDDAKTKTLVWTGKTANTYSFNASSESRNTFYKSNIQSILKKYPPQAQSKKKSNYYN